MWSFQEAVEVAALCLGSALTTIVIHEVGHLAAALALGWKVRAIAFLSWRSLGVVADPTGEAALSAAVFGRGLRFTALCGPLANIIAAVAFCCLAWVFRHGSLHRGLTPAILFLAVAIGQLGGALQLIPSNNKAGNALGNDGNVVFRAYKDQVLLEELLTDDESRC